MTRTTRTVPEGLGDAHEWLSFEDPEEDRTWVVDVTFLESAWRCIFRDGCQGVLTGPAPELELGCCSYGAHFTGEADAERVEATARTLSAEQWQFRSKGFSKNGRTPIRRNKDGELVTRLVEDACIFLNRPEHPGGAGCALHRAALDRGVEPLELKPDVCWQLPLRRQDEVADEGHVTSTVTEWRRRHWGPGGQEFHWWCTEAAEAFTGSVAVYESMKAEIVAMTSPEVYEIITRYMAQRAKRPIRLPHPAVRVGTPT